MFRTPFVTALAIVAGTFASVAESVAGWPTPAAGGSSSGGPEVLFTFDDGPHERHTRVILDTLAASDIKAIFFWTGRRVSGEGKDNDDRVALVDRAVADGHLIGNHTVHHRHLCKLSEEETADEIDDNAEVYAELTGMPLLLFRTPYGDRCRRLMQQLEDRGLAHLHWDIDPQEFRTRSAERTKNYVVRHIKRLRDDERAVVLMHDTQPATARALPEILDWLAKENQRREKVGRPLIRIVDATDYASEKFELGLGTWMAQVAGQARDRLGTALNAVIPGGAVVGDGKVQTARTGAR